MFFSVSFLFDISTDLSFKPARESPSELAALQKGCKAFLNEQSVDYEGDCKGGLAHGEGRTVGDDYYEGQFKKGKPHGVGTFYWKNGNSFKGNWKKGEKNGEGTFTMKRPDQKDSVLVGYWVKDKYAGKGPKKPPFKVLRQENVVKYRMQKVDEIDMQVEIRIRRQGRPFDINNLSNMSITGSSGISYQRSEGHGFDLVEFPMQGKVSCYVQTLIGNSFAPVIFDFEITEPGKWVVFLDI